jgi:hypothetical protein
MERRSFMKIGLLGAAVLAVAGGGLALWPGDSSARPTKPLLSISAGNFPVLVAVAARVCQGTTAQPVQVAHAVDAALSFTFPEARRDMDRVLGLLENALPGLLLRGSPRPFTLLDEAAQDRALFAWRDSSVGLLRGAYHALRKLCLAAHYATPGSWPEVDYGGPLIPKPDPPPMTATGSLVVDAVIKAEGMPQ